MRKLLLIKLAIILCLFITSNVYSAQVTLEWTPPTTNSDGTPLTDLAGYRLYYGTKSGVYDKNMAVPIGTTYQAEITGTSDGQVYYFVMTAYDIAGNESIYSNEINYTIPNVAPNTFIIKFK